MKKAFLLVVAVLMVAAMAIGASAAFSLDFSMSVNGVKLVNNDAAITGTWSATGYTSEGAEEPDGAIFTVADLKVNGVADTGVSLIVNGEEVAPEEDGTYVLGPATEDVVIEGYKVTLDMLRLEQNPGVEYTLMDATINDDGTYDLVIDIEVKEGYMIEDNDLHDGCVPTIFVARTKYNSAESTQKLVEITPNKDGYYTFESFGAEDNFIVDHVAPVVINIDEQIEEGTEIVLEADGHVYVIGAIANYGKITIVNSKTDYTKVIDGAYVDAFGHIQEPLKNTFKSYWANVRFAATAGTGWNFYNYGTLETVFATGVDGATRNYVLDLGHTTNLYNSGLINFNGSVTWNFTPNVTWQSWNARWQVNSTCGVTNDGTIKTGNAGPFNYKGVVKLIATFEDFKGYRLRGMDDGFVAPFVNNGTIELFASELTVNNLTNRGEIKLGARLTVQGLFNNAKGATITGESSVYKNPLTGVETMVAPFLRIQARTIAQYMAEHEQVKDGVQDFRKIVTANHINAGTININTSNENNVFRTYGIFTNTGDMTVGGFGGSLVLNGQIINKGNFNYIATTDAQSSVSSELLVEADGWTYLEQTVAGETNFEVYPLGIQNDGTMRLEGFFFFNSGGKLVNNGEMTIAMKEWVNHAGNWQAELDEEDGYCDPSLSSFSTVKADVLVYDNCDNCPGHATESEFVIYDGRVFNNGKLEIPYGLVGVEMFYNGKGAELNISGSTVFFNGIKEYDSSKVVSRCLSYFTHDQWIFENLGKVSMGGIFGNIGRFENKGEFVMETGTFYNFSEFNNAKGASFVNNAIFKNFDEENLEKVTAISYVMNITHERYDASFTVADMFEGYALNKGEFVNNGTLYNEYGYDFRNEGTLDNVNGKITNKGMIVNVGTFTSTVEGIDNQFAIHGYDVTYVNKADAETPADTTAKADVETPADTTKAPVKTPAAQTSDVAVAGFAVIATLALAGVVVAKKVR